MTQTITLRRAAKIRNRLQSRLAELERAVQSASTAVNIYDPDLLEQLHGAVERHQSSVAQYEMVSNVTESLRVKIGQANHAAGITDLLTRQAALAGRLAVYRRVMAMPVMPTDAQIQARIDAARTTTRDSYGSSDIAAYSPVTAETAESARQLSHTLQFKFDAIQDSLESLNANTTIELDDVELAVLQSEQMI